jgi:WD40 repeat protein
MNNENLPARTNSIHICDLATGKIVQSIPSPEKSTPWSLLEFSPDGQKLAFTAAHQIHIWDLSTNKECWTSPKLDCQVGAIAVSPDGRRLATGLYDTSVLIWDVSTHREK